MRRSLPSTLLPVAVLMLALLGGGALATAAGPASSRASLARAARAVGRSVVRRMSIASPRPSDLSLAQIRFGLSAPSGAALGARPPADYVVVVRRRALGRSGAVLLVLVVNRAASGSGASTGRVALNVRVPRSGGVAKMSVIADVYGRSTRSGAAMCASPPRGALPAHDLTPVLAAGSPLPGFSGPAAVAQAFDAACGRRVDPRFHAAVTGASPVAGGPTGPTGPTGPSGPSGPTGPCPPTGAAIAYRCCPAGSSCAVPPCACCSPTPCPAIDAAAEAAPDVVVCPVSRSAAICY